jgi:hypothetical protein
MNSVSPSKNPLNAKRFLSPPPPKSPATTKELERKQEKARELRQSALDVKTEQWNVKAGKVRN